MSNQRAFPRYPLSLDVSVSSADRDDQICHVRDYCPGGMFLLCGANDHSPAEGTEISIRFINPDSPSESYMLEGRVARSMSHGIGVSFTEMNQVALMVMAQLAQKQASLLKKRGGSVSGDVSTIVRECRELGRQAIERVARVFLEEASERLFEAAQVSIINTEQSAFFGARNELRRERSALEKAMVDELAGRFAVLDKPGYAVPLPGQEQGGESLATLSLIDNQELDNWLVVRAVATKLEQRTADALEALETRLAEIAVNHIDKENNPVGPMAMSSIFSRAVNGLSLEAVARKVIMTVLEGVLEFELKGLYDKLNDLLISHGILPALKKNMEVVKVPGADHGGGEAAADDVPDDESMAQEGGGTNQGSGYGASSGRRAGQASAMHQGGLRQEAGGGHAPNLTPMMPQMQYNRFPATLSQMQFSRVPDSPSVERPPMMLPYQEMQELMHLQGSGAAEAPIQTPSGYFSSGEVMRALSRLDGFSSGERRSRIDTQGHVQTLMETLGQVTGDRGKGLSDEVRDTISYVGGLFSSMHQDQHLPSVARPWLERLEVPLLKAGITDHGMMDDSEHPARQLVNSLEEVGRFIQSDKQGGEQAIRQVDELLDEVRKRVEQDPNIFAEVQGKIDGLRESYRAVYRKNISSVIDECKRESALNRKRDQVLESLNELLGKREVPVVILTLLESGLKNQLFRTYVKGGAESEDYKFYLNFIDQLTARLMERAPIRSRKVESDAVLRGWLPKGLSGLSGGEKQATALTHEIDSYLEGRAKPNLKYVPQLVLKSQHLDEGHSRPEEVSGDAWSLLLEDVRAIADGESFLFTDDVEGKQEITLIWRDDEDRPPRYVFADGGGEKSLDLSLGEVANLLYHRVLARMELRDMSVTERATYDFLQNIHNNLSFQAQHDELTGLWNRKAFERKLEEVYTDAITTKQGGVLGYMDLDRFNIINTTCGHSEGDKLLQQVADIFRERAGDGAMVARLGGDEFGIILGKTSRVEALKRVNALHDAIREVRFACEDNEFKVTASMGIAEINDSIDSSGRLLSAVDAACFTAKDQGRDNIQIHNPENARISNRNNILEWVGRINVLFDKNLIQLRCQKIDPLHKTVNSLPHYEILLEVKDENGNVVPTEDFIVAAERYNRITDIDTWVVNRLLDWVDEHRSKLNRINGVSINLSGNSIGNRHFMEHLQERMAAEGFPADKVIFEVTETIAINNLDNAARFMRMLKSVGCRFSLDDFGSGTSSYAYLRSLPIDFLKIDGAFVKDIAKNTNDYAVVKSINEIGHVMGLKTVAEFVEDEFALQAVKAIGLDYVQGFGVERPIPLKKLFG